MIHINKPEPDDQDWIDWCAAAKTAQEAMLASFKPGTKPQINKDLYKAQKAALLKLFNEKCAYCEMPIPEGMHTIDHFRPKAGVVEEDGTVAMCVDEDGVEREHPGYYWLAYDQRNLLPSCKICNEPSAAGGKGSYFPLKTPADGSKPFRAHRPEDEGKEEPLFVHPRFEDPAAHLAFDDTGAIIALTEKGKKCIERLLLDREALMTARRQAYKDARDKFNAYMGKSRADTMSVEELQTEILGWQEGKRPYSAPARVAIKEEANITEKRLRALGIA
jgi:hypothetical protein